MEKQLLILIAEAKYPSSTTTFLFARSGVFTDIKDLSQAWAEFRSELAADGFEILNNSMVYVVPEDQIQAFNARP